MVAIANDNVYMQSWIGTEDKLARMVRVVFRDASAGLSRAIDGTIAVCSVRGGL